MDGEHGFDELLQKVEPELELPAGISAEEYIRHLPIWSQLQLLRLSLQRSLSSPDIFKLSEFIFREYLAKISSLGEIIP